MAVTCVFGATECGKSFYVEHFLLKTRKKKIVFDGARCFKSGVTFQPLAPVNDPQGLVKEFQKWNKPEFFYIFRPGRDEDRKIAFDKVISWAVALGRTIGDRVDPENRLLLVCDEADRLCTPSAASRKFDYIINEGRHDNVDSVFICRDPNNLFIDARKNASTVVTFKNPIANQMPYFINLLGRELALKVSALPKYHYLKWRDNGEVTITDHKGKIYYKEGF